MASRSNFPGRARGVPCCCLTIPVDCLQCPPGTVYPYLVDVTFVEIGVTVPAGNQDDLDEDGETSFHYYVEGDYDGYTIQANFGDCEANLTVSPYSPGGSCSVSGNTNTAEITMEAVSCPPDPLILIYTIQCQEGGTITVVITD